MPSNATQTFSLDHLLNHPFAIYGRNFGEARSKVTAEASEQSARGDNGNFSTEERAEARVRATELTSELGHMDEADRAFTVRILVAPFPPKDEVVDRTIALNAALSVVVAAANKAAAIVKLAKDWADWVTATVTGAAPA